MGNNATPNGNTPNAKTGDAAATETKLTAADAAKLVKRTVVTTDKAGKEVTEKVAVKADEVLDFKDYGNGRVVVVTKDGQKFDSAEA